MLRFRKLTMAFLLLSIFFFMNLSNILAADPCFEGFSTLTGNVVYVFRWDPKNPDEIDPDNSKPISVIHGKPPYTWSVNEEDEFTLEHDETSGRSNTLHADSGACGTAEIIVTDDLGEVVTGYVRCTTGHLEWICSGDHSRWSSCWPDPYGNDWVWVWDEKGKYSYHLGMGCHYSPYNCLFSSCNGHTAYIPPDWNGKMCPEGCPGRPQCDDNGPVGCCYGQVKLIVYEWTCP